MAALIEIQAKPMSITDQQLLDRLMECEEELRQIRRERKALKKGIAPEIRAIKQRIAPSLQVSENMPNKSGFGLDNLMRN